jgi:hypothetical protein
MRRTFHRLSKTKGVLVLAVRYMREVKVGLHLFLISALDEGQWLTKRSGRFILRKERRYLLNRKLGWSKSRSECFGSLNIFSLYSDSNSEPSSP